MEIILIDNHLVVYKPVVDLYFYLVADLNENEIMLYQLLNTITQALEISMKQLEKRVLLENMDYLLLTLDEIIDDGSLG